MKYLLWVTLAVVLDLLWPKRHVQPVTSFTITIGETMHIHISGDSKGVRFTAAPDHPLKQGETPVWTTSDASALALAPDPSDPSGLTAIGTPVKDALGLVVTISVTRPDGKAVTDNAAPID